jgi:Double zinc ribbon
MPAPHRHDMIPMRLLMSFSFGTAAASYILLIGYISRDAKRRNMSAKLWILLAIGVPGFIGAVVYFLLRQPMLSRCPNCTTEIAEGFHFCPQCQFQLAPVCGQCFRSVEITDVYCVQCGHDLAHDHTPARLRSYSN